MKKNGLSDHTYGDIFWRLDESVRCRNTIYEATEVDRAIVALREDFLHRITRGKSMRLSLECMEDILRNGRPIISERALAFRNRKAPEIHLRWLREQMEARGLS